MKVARDFNYFITIVRYDSKWYMYLCNKTLDIGPRKPIEMVGGMLQVAVCPHLVMVGSSLIKN